MMDMQHVVEQFMNLNEIRGASHKGSAVRGKFIPFKVLWNLFG